MKDFHQVISNIIIEQDMGDLYGKKNSRGND